MISFICAKNCKLSKYVCENVEGLPYGTIKKLLREKSVKVNGRRVKEDVLLCPNDLVEIYYKVPEKSKFDELYIDKNILVVFKKVGFTSEVLFEDVVKKYPTACFVHRLDRNTSGIMVFPLTKIAEEEFLLGFKKRTFIKTYTARVKGVMPKKSDVLTHYLIKDSESATVKIYNKKVKGSTLIKTGYSVIESDQKTSLLSVNLYTGKTHQIRAHLAYIGNPIVGDGKYGDNAFNKEYGALKQLLCATELKLVFNKESSLYYLNGKSFNVKVDF